MNVSELSGRVKIFSLVKDEDGSISRVPMCLCELCRVNHFLCPRYASHSAAGEAVLDERKRILDEIRVWLHQHCYWFYVNGHEGEQRYHFEVVKFREFLEELREQQGER